MTSKLSKGRYFAPLTIGGTGPRRLPSRLVLRVRGWRRADAGHSTRCVTDEAFGPPSYYATVQDVYDTGLSPVTYTVKNVRGALAKAHALIERWTGRVFRPQYKGAPRGRLRRHEAAPQGSPSSLWAHRCRVDEYVQGYLFEEEDSGCTSTTGTSATEPSRPTTATTRTSTTVTPRDRWELLGASLTAPRREGHRHVRLHQAGRLAAGARRRSCTRAGGEDRNAPTSTAQPPTTRGSPRTRGRSLRSARANSR